jgi:hypothetical protein
MAWTRREFLTVAGTVAAGAVARVARGTAVPPRPAPPKQSPMPRAAGTPDPAGVDAPDRRAGEPDLLAATRDDLHRLVTTRALAVDDPWVLMHVLLPLGPDVRRDAEPVLDSVVQTWVEPVTAGGQVYPNFPLAVEAHPNHFVEIMYATGVAPDRAFVTKAGRITRADLYAGAKALFSAAFAGAELAWTVSVFTAEMRPGADRFENAAGRSVTVAAVVEAVAQAAEAGYADTVAAMRGKKPYDRSAIQGYACNGTHVLYGLLDAVRNGYRANRLPERVTLLMQAALFRLGPEVALIDRVIAGGGGAQAALNADAAKLQFLGHSLENLAFARRHRLYEPSAAEESGVRAAERELATVAHRLVATHDLDGLKRQLPRAYWVILGDACHALHAMQIAGA